MPTASVSASVSNTDVVPIQRILVKWRHWQKICQRKENSVWYLCPDSLPSRQGYHNEKSQFFLPLFLSEPGVVTGTSCCELQRVTLQFSSVAQSCLTLCDPMDCSTPGLPVHHQLPEFTQTHVHRVCDTIQLSHPLSSPSPPSFNLSQHRVFSNWSFLCVRWPKY